jgi:hypothetical protein
MTFGLDGFLYITTGDGTSDSDGWNSGQALDDLLGSVLRIDVDRPESERASASATSRPGDGGNPRLPPGRPWSEPYSAQETRVRTRTRSARLSRPTMAARLPALRTRSQIRSMARNSGSVT